MTNLLQRTLGERVTLNCVAEPDLWMTFADPNQLENAILNLCVNGVDAMPNGGTLTIKASNRVVDDGPAVFDRAGLAPGEYVVVAVSDTGDGMPPDVVARAFEPFFTTKPVGKGTGLGLSQVYGFARQSRGDVVIGSDAGRGTKVEILLPRSRPGNPLPAPARGVGVESDVKAAVELSKTGVILVVEDDDLVRNFSAAALRDAGYSIIEASTGPEALDRLKEHPGIALLFTDVVLKGPLNGRELADQTLDIRPDLPVLFTTGYTRDAVLHRGGHETGLNLINKPFTPAALIAKIAGIFSGEARAESDAIDTTSSA